MCLTLLACFAIATLGTAGSARADDPCKAIADDGALPRYLSFGARFTGLVVHVIDGDSFIVAVGDGPANWVEVRTAGW